MTSHPDALADAVTERDAFPDSSARFGVQRGAPGWVVQARISVATLCALLAPVLYRPTLPVLILFAVSYVVRMWATEAIYHRYFAHRAFQAGRLVQCVLALLGTQNGQRGPLWWAAAHRLHHRNADEANDPHSPRVQSFLHAFAAWFWDARHSDTDLDVIPDYARFPELRWINRNYALPLYGGGTLLAFGGHAGWLGPDISAGAALLWGFFLPVTAVLVSVSLVNTTCHMPELPGGYRRYDTPDFSVNRPLLALITLGGGWHNNHHRYAVPARAGFVWWEIDPSYYVLRALEAMRVVRNVKGTIPQELLRRERR